MYDPIGLKSNSFLTNECNKLHIDLSVALQHSIGKRLDYEGIARTQSPTNKNYALELPTFGAIVGVSQTEVQWDGLILEEPPS